MNKIFIGIGSNLGNRLTNLKIVVNKISLIKTIELISQSKVYESEPMYYVNQNFFLNMVIEINSSDEPLKLLEILKNIEYSIGRTSNQMHNHPRIIDLDILDYSNCIINESDLKLPHPKFKERLFVLKPWNDIAPNHVVSDSKLTIYDLMLLLDSNNKFVKLYVNNI